jgi:transposase
MDTNQTTSKLEKTSRPKKFYKKLVYQQKQITSGMKGILATCHRGQEHSCTRELVRLLDEVSHLYDLLGKCVVFLHYEKKISFVFFFS